MSLPQEMIDEIMKNVYHLRFKDVKEELRIWHIKRRGMNGLNSLKNLHSFWEEYRKVFKYCYQTFHVFYFTRPCRGPLHSITFEDDYRRHGRLRNYLFTKIWENNNKFNEVINSDEKPGKYRWFEKKFNTEFFNYDKQNTPGVDYGHYYHQIGRW